ncbi:MAG: CoA pyrophosphatase [Desulfamplus sp.]|nr:CoA pyrophosphatase [Desulfamplus sp.]
MSLKKSTNCYQLISQAILEANHPKSPDEWLFQPTSVIALFTKIKEEITLILIQKADIEGYPWRNQMAFPGGNCDPEDISREATALRELKEEMGILPEDVKVIGSIGHFQTIKNKDIEAFVGMLDNHGDDSFDPSKIIFDTAEISRVFAIPLSHLIDVHKKRNFTGRLPALHELTYSYEDVVIWGVTAKIIHHLIEILAPKVEHFCTILTD